MNSKPTVSPALACVAFISIFVPTHISIELGGLRLTPYRICLLIFLAGSLAYLLRAITERGHGVEKLTLCYSIWATISIAVNHGFAVALESGGILLVETLGPLLLAFAYCSSYNRVVRTVRALGISGSLLLLISVPESITGINWFSLISGADYGGIHSAIDKRMGFYRAQASFDHPILFGVVMSSIVGLTYFSGFQKYSLASLLATVTSLSSGAIASLFVQATLVIWHKILKGFKKKWTLYCLSVFLLWAAAELYSNRSGIMALLSLITFSAHTAYNRMHIWNFGMDNVYDNPIFGLGYDDWVRPSWMHSGSMDNFWLVITVRHGVPAFAFYASAIWLLARSILNSKTEERWIRNIERGWLVGLAGCVVAGGTVHLWNTSYVYFNFYLGLGLAITHLASQANRPTPGGKSG